MDFTVSMAVFDFIPVILYLIYAVIMQRGLYKTMTKGGFAVFSAGTIIVVTAGAFKATWKLLYALGICDFQALNYCFMPMEAVGFTLAAIAMLGYVFSKTSKQDVKIAAVPVITSSMPFVIVMVLGVFGVTIGHVVLAARKKRVGTVVVFILSFVLQLAMGYLSSRDFTEASMNWIAEAVNAAAMTTLVIGATDLKKHVFA